MVGLDLATLDKLSSSTVGSRCRQEALCVGSRWDGHYPRARRPGPGQQNRAQLPAPPLEDGFRKPRGVGERTGARVGRQAEEKGPCPRPGGWAHPATSPAARFCPCCEDLLQGEATRSTQKTV